MADSNHDVEKRMREAPCTLLRSIPINGFPKARQGRIFVFTGGKRETCVRFRILFLREALDTAAHAFAANTRVLEHEPICFAARA